MGDLLTARSFEKENRDEPERCPVLLYKEYMAHVPKDAPANSFYLRPLKLKSQKEIFGTTSRSRYVWAMSFLKS